MDLPTKEIAGLLRQTAWELLSAADEFDPPIIDESPKGPCFCPRCGAEYLASEYFPGCECEIRGCDGYLKRRGVSGRDELAMAATLGALPADEPDIASTYWGRS